MRPETPPAFTVPKEALPKMQAILLEMLLEVGRICQAHGLRYCLYGGTMLGAVRHGGFIPWDDDADVTMPRADYDRFRALCATELDQGRFYYQDHKTTPGYRWGYAKLRRHGTQFVRAKQEHMPYEQGVFLDIFPQDGVPDALWYPFSGACFCVRKLQWSAVGRYVAKSPLLRGWYALLYRAVPHSLILKCYDGLVRLGQKHPQSKYTRVISWNRTRGRREGMRREWFENPQPVQFEGHTLQGVADADVFLTYIFGDYMALPPEAQRKPGHLVSRCELPGLLTEDAAVNPPHQAGQAKKNI